VIRLGLRLARAGGPVRLLSLFIGGALSVVLLGLAWGLPDALYPRYEHPLEPGTWLSPTERGAATAMSSLMLAPVLMLLISTARVSSVIRDRRLVSLRLIGVSKGRTLLVAVTENVAVTAAGAVVGTVLLGLAAGVVDARLPVAEPFRLDAWQLVILGVGTVVGAGVLALGSARTLELLPTQARRGGVAPKASWWRLAPVAAALGCFGAIVILPTDVVGTGTLAAALFVSGVATAALGIATMPALVARYSATRLRRSRRFPTLMAGRGIEADPVSATRRVAAVGIGIFVLAVTASVMNAWESVPQSRFATFNAERGPQAVMVRPGDETSVLTAADVAAFAATVPGAQYVVHDYGLKSTECDASAWTACFTPFVGTCVELAAYMPVTGCSDEHAAWINTAGRELDARPVRTTSPPSVEFRADPESARTADDEPFLVEVAAPAITVDWDAVYATRGYPLEVDLFIPEHLVAGRSLSVHSFDVVGPPGREFADAVALAARERGLEADSWSYGDYTTLVSIRTMVGSAGAALVAVVVLIVSLSVLDWLRESRRSRMRLLALGLPRRTIARIYLWQFGIPLLGAVALGGALGGAGLRAYEVMGSDVPSVGVFHLPPTYWWLAGTLVGGALLSAGLAGLAAHERMRPEDLRQE